MSTGCLKKPSRPPPPPPIEYPSSFSNGGSSGSVSHRSSDYIKISECHTGLPERPPKPIGFKSRASTSFSSPTNFIHSNHQKSRSLLDNHCSASNRQSSYLYLDLPSDFAKNSAPTPPSIVYKTVDFLKTEALNKCKVERTSGRGYTLR